MNELPPLQAVRDIRLHVLRETDSLRRMHLVQAVIHACLDELDAAPATMLDRVVRISRPRRCWTGLRELAGLLDHLLATHRLCRGRRRLRRVSHVGTGDGVRGALRWSSWWAFAL